MHREMCFFFSIRETCAYMCTYYMHKYAKYTECNVTNILRYSLPCGNLFYIPLGD